MAGNNYGRRGLFDFGGGWGNGLGLIGAALKDVGAAWDGNLGDANNVMRLNGEQRKQREEQQLLADLQSPDPATRQRARNRLAVTHSRTSLLRDEW